jgi:hypothetical protein
MKSLLALLLTFTALAQTSTVVIVPAALVGPANALAKQEFDATGGEFTFTAALVTPPGTNTTHYWCATPFTATNRLKLNVLTNTPPFAGNVLVLDYSLTSQPTAPFEFLATNGLAVPTQSIF